MKSLQDYGNHFLNELLELRIPLLEVTLMVALVLMCLVNAIEFSIGGELEGQEQLNLARQQAQQELMALRSAIQPN